jgi:hypothetical protein
MSILAVTSYSVVKALHIMAALIAYGLPLSAPLLLPYLRRVHPRALPGFHDVQHRCNVRVTGPFTVLLFAFGAYLAGKEHLWDETWVQVPLLILLVIVVLGGWVVRATRRLADLAREDVARTDAGGAIAWSADYERTYRTYLAVESLLGVLVLAAIFFMAAKPFA